MNQAKLLLGGAAGLFADVYLPAMLLGLAGKPDTGILSYAAAALVWLGGTWGLNKANMPNAAKGFFVGAGAALAWRAADDLSGTKLVQIDTGMGSFFVKVPNASAPLPGPNVFPGGRAALPAGASPSASSSPVAASAPAGGGMGWFYA
jgi:hypothetical protein